MNFLADFKQLILNEVSLAAENYSKQKYLLFDDSEIFSKFEVEKAEIFALNLQLRYFDSLKSHSSKVGSTPTAATSNLGIFLIEIEEFKIDNLLKIVEQFTSIYFIFLGQSPQRLLDEIRKNRSLRQKIEGFKEILLKVSSLGDNYFVTKKQQDLKESANLFLNVLEMAKINAKDIHIKYYHDSLSSHFALNLFKAMQISLEDQEKLGQIDSVDTSQKTTVIILNRNYDMVTPLVHSSTYRSMIIDLLKTTHNQVFVPGLDTPISLLSTDKFYKKLRNMYIGDAGPEIDNFINHNAYLSVKYGKSVAKEIQDLTDQIYGSQDSKLIENHHLIYDGLVKIYEAKNLGIIAEFEQSLATMIDTDGKYVTSDIIPRIKESLKLHQFDIDDKLRLLLILNLQFPTVDVTELVKETVGDKGIDGLRGLEKIKNVTNHTTYTPKKPKEDISTTSENFLNRYEPILGQIIHDVLQDSDIPFLTWLNKPPPPSSTEEDTLNLSTFTPTWGLHIPTDESTSLSLDSKNRLVFFIVGGMTMSEIEVIKEYQTKFQCQIYIGSDVLIRGGEYLNGICNLGYGDATPFDLAIPVDEIRMEVQKAEQNRIAKKNKNKFGEDKGQKLNLQPENNDSMFVESEVRLNLDKKFTSPNEQKASNNVLDGNLVTTSPGETPPPLPRRSESGSVSTSTAIFNPDFNGNSMVNKSSSYPALPIRSENTASSAGEQFDEQKPQITNISQLGSANSSGSVGNNVTKTMIGAKVVDSPGEISTKSRLSEDPGLISPTVSINSVVKSMDDEDQSAVDSKNGESATVTSTNSTPVSMNDFPQEPVVEPKTIVKPMPEPEFFTPKLGSIIAKQAAKTPVYIDGATFSSPKGSLDSSNPEFFTPLLRRTTLARSSMESTPIKVVNSPRISKEECLIENKILQSNPAVQNITSESLDSIAIVKPKPKEEIDRGKSTVRIVNSDDNFAFQSSGSEPTNRYSADEPVLKVAQSNVKIVVANPDNDNPKYEEKPRPSNRLKTTRIAAQALKSHFEHPNIQRKYDGVALGQKLRDFAKLSITPENALLHNCHFSRNEIAASSLPSASSYKGKSEIKTGYVPPARRHIAPNAMKIDHSQDFNRRTSVGSFFSGGVRTSSPSIVSNAPIDGFPMFQPKRPTIYQSDPSGLAVGSQLNQMQAPSRPQYPQQFRARPRPTLQQRPPMRTNSSFHSVDTYSAVQGQPYRNQPHFQNNHSQNYPSAPSQDYSAFPPHNSSNQSPSNGYSDGNGHSVYYLQNSMVSSSNQQSDYPSFPHQNQHQHANPHYARLEQRGNRMSMPNMVYSPEGIRPTPLNRHSSDDFVSDSGMHSPQQHPPGAPNQYQSRPPQNFYPQVYRPLANESEQRRYSQECHRPTPASPAQLLSVYAIVGHFKKPGSNPPSQSNYPGNS